VSAIAPQPGQRFSSEGEGEMTSHAGTGGTQLLALDSTTGDFPSYTQHIETGDVEALGFS
jgi:hypothetical protein